MEIIKNSRQIPKTKDICSSKKYYDILYAYLQCISTMSTDMQTGEVVRLFKKKDINFSKLGTIFNLSRQTVSTKFKNLIQLGLVVDYNVEEYQLITLEQDTAMLIPYDTLKILTDALNENSISVYVYLFTRYYRNNCQPFQFTLESVKKHIGICASTRSNDEIITNILFVLQKMGLVKYSMTTAKQEADSFQNVKTIYQIDWITNTLR